MIKQGAKLIENIDDILEEILPQIERTTVLKPHSIPTPKTLQLNHPKYSMQIDQNNHLILFPEAKFILMI